MKAESIKCSCCGASSDEFFEVDVETDENGVPFSFTVYKGPFVFGGIGTPDRMVMSCMLTAATYWEKKGKKNLRKGDYVASVGVYLSEVMQQHVSDEVKSVVSLLFDEKSVHVHMN